MGEEKRREKRTNFIAPVMLLTGKGISQNFNSSDIYFVTEKFLPPGCPINFMVLLEHASLDKPLQLHCRGLVLRVEEVGKKFGIVASGLLFAGYFTCP
jgi:hypothetical protein